MKTIAIATMHGKEKAIGPALHDRLGCEWMVPAGMDTDRFGTFSGETPRTGDQLEAARLKCREAHRITGITRVIASEGSFGPHPLIPFSAAGIELLLYCDFEKGLEIIVSEIFSETNFASAIISDWDALEAFACRAGFPSHHLILRSTETDFRGMLKGLHNWKELKAAFDTLHDGRNTMHVSTDMRAMCNPTRMKSIGVVSRMLAERLCSFCPGCGTEGFGPVAMLPGKKCSECGMPTKMAMARILRCAACGIESYDYLSDGHDEAEAMYCDHCNP